ncbi:zinc finger protein 16-like isoform X1 [Neodiprion fabricii]|uniref:zinc finger protein 16-like isoform X1 n=2 Tax=Neodiprion fabricii TaxID=2872261 RepID=UPI001ED924FC|nr:zinc finger protein 16-like isoform X1 [Neodiprion fabricii]
MGTAGRDFDRDRECEQCRICANNVSKDEGVYIFSEESRRHYLQAKIRKYLYVLVSSDDKLPQIVCSTCTKRLDGIHRFATMAHRAQEKLRLQLSEIMENVKEADEMADGKIRINPEATRRLEDRGLLHSILTQVRPPEGAIEILAEGEPLESVSLLSHEDSEHTQSMEEMEVKVDPMLFLQCALEQSGSDVSDVSDNEDKESRTSSPEPPSVTHKNIEIKQEPPCYDTKPFELMETDEDVLNNSIKPYECTICARSFISQIGLQNHLWSHLPRDHRFDGKPILRSQQVFSTNGVLHTSSDNNSTGNFICPICSKRISTKGNLKVHLETHRPKGKYGCDICGRIFKTQSNLFRHKEYHGGIQFPCNVCGRVYPTNSTLRAHSITHSDLRPHACPLCDKTFKRNQDLKFHINQHTGARPYQCPYCPKAFASSGNCFSHRKRMHPREVHRDRQRAADLMR